MERRRDGKCSVGSCGACDVGLRVAGISAAASQDSRKGPSETSSDAARTHASEFPEDLVNLLDSSWLVGLQVLEVSKLFRELPRGD